MNSEPLSHSDNLTRDDHTLDEVKLVLVGRGASGKTSIASRLIHDSFTGACTETQGVEITTWPLRVGDREVRTHIWDFAGQVVTHSTHQFFFSESSIYILALTGREDLQRYDGDYWLRLIRAFATDSSGTTSPVVIALNKFDDHPFVVDRNLLREKYPFIVDFIETDCRSGRGISTLRERIQQLIGEIPFAQLKFRASWWKVKEELEAIQKDNNYLSYSDFQAICTKAGESNPDQQRFLAQILHILGIALNYSQDARLRTASVLNPRWVTENIYKILREGVPHDSATAELTAERLEHLLPHEPAGMRSYLIELMRRFDLAFPLDETGDRWLLPQRLPSEQPKLAPVWNQAADATRLRYKYQIIPEGLLPRFISRTYPLSEDVREEHSPRWINGVVLRDREARALVRVNVDERQIEIVAIGPIDERKALLGVIQADFRALHKQISGLDQQEELEIEGRPGIFVLVEALKKDETQRKKSSASTTEGTISFAPSTELDRLSNKKSRKAGWRPKVFISYSSYDSKLKDELLIRLKPMMETDGLLECWNDRCISPGEEWDREIRQELKSSDVILLLVSARFLASDYIRSVEVATAVQRANEKEAVLIPVVLDRCAYEQEPFGKFNALPFKGKPIRDRKPQRQAWYEVAEELRRILTQAKARHERKMRASIRRKDGVRTVARIKAVIASDNIQLLFRPITHMEGSSIRHFDVVAHSEEMPNFVEFSGAVDRAGLTQLLERRIFSQIAFRLNRRETSRIAKRKGKSMPDYASLYFIDICAKTFHAANRFHRYLESFPYSLEGFVFKLKDESFLDQKHFHNPLIPYFRERGVKISISDFGRFSNWERILESLRPDFVEPSPIFTRDQSSKIQNKILLSLIRRARNSEANVIFGPEESSHVMARMWKMGVNYVRGDLFSSDENATAFHGN